MSLVIFALVAANLSLYFAVISVTPYFHRMLPCSLAALFLSAAACALGCAVSEKKPALRFVFVVLPPLALLLAVTPAHMLLLAPAIIYGELILVAGRFNVSYWAYRNHYLWSSCALFLLLFSGLAAQLGVKLSLDLALAFGISALVLGAFTLRQLRFGARTSLLQKGLELTSLAALPAAVGIVARLSGYLQQAAGWLLERLLYPLAWLMERFIAAIVAYFNRFKLPDEEKEIMRRREYNYSDDFHLPEQTGEEVVELSDPPRTDLRWLWIVLGVVAVLIAAYVVYRIYRHLRDTRSDETLAASDRLESDFDAGERAVSAAEAQSNRRKVRRQYEKYLKLLQHRGFARRAQDSSEDVLEKSQALTAPEPAQALRRLYILARYQPDAAISGAQVQQAKRLLRQLREEPES